MQWTRKGLKMWTKLFEKFFKGICPVAWGCRIQWQDLKQRVKTPQLKSVLDYDIIPSDNEL